MPLPKKTVLRPGEKMTGIIIKHWLHDCFVLGVKKFVPVNCFLFCFVFFTHLKITHKQNFIAWLLHPNLSLDPDLLFPQTILAFSSF